MENQTELIRNLRVASPCHVGWERMSGDERVRFCDSCQLHVYNLSEMTTREIESLVLKTRGRICGRMYKRSDGTIIARDCPVGLRAVRRRVSRRATAILATLLSLGSSVFSQSKDDKVESCKQSKSIEIERKKSSALGASIFRGRVIDPVSAVVPNAKVTLFTKSSKSGITVITDVDGMFSLDGFKAGVYSLKVEAHGFKAIAVKAIELKSDEAVTATLVLQADGVVTMGIIVATPDIESSNGTTIIRGDYIRKLPINN